MKNTTKFFAAITLLTGTVWVAAPLVFAQSVAKPDGVLAKAGEASIDVGELRALLTGVDPAARKALSDNPSLMSQAVRSLLVERLVLEEAVAKGWDKNEEVVKLVGQARDKVIVQSYLADAIKMPEGFPSDLEVRTVYDANKDKLKLPKQFRLAQIFVAKPAGGGDVAVEAAKSKLDGVVGGLGKADADFAAVARAMSEEPQSAGRDGEIGWLAASQIRPEILAAVGQLEPGRHTDVIELEDGWHIVKLIETRDERTPDFDEVRDALASQILRERLVARREAYLAKLLQDNPVAINELELADVVAAEGAESAGE